MRIRHNVSSAFAWRALADSSAKVTTSIARLSSGSRINSAADDAAGMSISERMRSQFLSLSQAARNAQDGLNLVNTADATLDEVLSLLQRGRELSVQAANGVYEPQQLTTIQGEVENLLSEVDRIADTAEFNKIKLFTTGSGAGSATSIVAGLRTSWLQQAEDVIRTHYGLTGDNTGLTISLTRGTGRSGYITGTVEPGGEGKLTEITITLDLDELAKTANPDRIVARAMTQAVLARNSNYVSLSKWFVSGASDLVAGGDEILAQALKTYTPASIVAALETPWADDLLHQASAYLAVKYVQAYAAFYGYSMVDPMAWLKNAGDLDAALTTTIFMNELGFRGDFSVNGEAYLDTLVTGGLLDDADVGGVSPGDAKAVIPDGGSYSLNPTQNFAIKWQGVGAESNSLQLHVGAGANDRITISLPQIGRFALDLLGVDVTKRAAEAIGAFSASIQKVTSARSQLGSTANALEHTVRSNQEAELSMRSSFSRIHDADYAQELVTLTKKQILVQSSSLMLAKADRLREHTAWLLSGLRGGGSLPSLSG
ncbi:MAG TPA: flagellin [Symbiobacteriaceae bacterium]|nr:flagellin [Symbiobacteriaceae bacterium]